MAATITRIRPREASPARWQQALERATAQGVQVRQLQCGVWVAASGTDPNAAYAVTLTDCECRAASEGDPVCKHRAALAYHLGILEDGRDPEPPPTAPAAPSYACAVCEDTGAIVKESTIFFGRTYYAPCPACRPRIDVAAFLAAQPSRATATAA